jgi:flagella basal body P-ring formation protein FlgA
MKVLKIHFCGRVCFAVAAFVLAMGVCFPATSSGGTLPPLHEAVREYIETNMPWQKGHVRVEFLSSEFDLPVSGSDIRIEPAGNMEFIGDATFFVRVMVRGRIVRTETVRTRIEVLRDTVVAARMIKSGAVLSQSDVRTAKKWVRRIMPDALASLDEAIGKRILTQVKPGMELTSSMLREATLVRKGRLVKVLFDNGSLRIMTIGMPEEDGTAGNIIRIRNVTSNKIIYARVLGDSLVGIEI